MIFKKSGSILCEGNRLAQYQFIQKYQQTFGVRWLLRRMNICPNAYYNYLKNKGFAGKINDSKDRDVINNKSKSADDSHKKPNKTKGFSL